MTEPTGTEKTSLLAHLTPKLSQSFGSKAECQNSTGLTKCLRLITAKRKHRLHSEAKKRPAGSITLDFPLRPTAAMLISRFGAKS